MKILSVLVLVFILSVSAVSANGFTGVLTTTPEEFNGFTGVYDVLPDNFVRIIKLSDGSLVSSSGVISPPIESLFADGTDVGNGDIFPSSLFAGGSSVGNGQIARGTEIGNGSAHPSLLSGGVEDGNG